MMNLKIFVAVVTGGASGLGEATVRNIVSTKVKLLFSSQEEQTIK